MARPTYSLSDLCRSHGWSISHVRVGLAKEGWYDPIGEIIKFGNPIGFCSNAFLLVMTKFKGAQNALYKVLLIL
jgi:hypothetical protein